MTVIGETVRRTYDIVTIKVPYPSVKSGVETIQPPNGFAIVSYRKIERSKYGRSGYSFSLKGDASFGVDSRQISQAFREISEYAKEKGKEEKYKERLDYLKEYAEDLYSHSISSHSTLTCKWHCKHDGWELNRKGGALDLAVEIELMRSFTQVDLESLLEAFKASIRNDAPPEELKLSLI